MRAKDLLAVLVIVCFQRGDNLQMNVVNIADPVSKYENFTCGGRWSCEFDPEEPDASPETYLRHKNCACDNVCAFFNDCCTDSEYYNVSLPTPLRAVPREVVECRRNYYVTGYTDIYQVSKCRPGYVDYNVSDLCGTEDESDLLLMVPVTGKGSGLLYKNFYCAMCHQEDYMFWIPSIHCGSFSPLDLNLNTTFKDAFDNINCRLNILPPNNHTYYHPCDPDYDPHATCPHPYNDTVLDDLCQSTTESSQLVFSASKKLFKNKYCSLCHNEEPTCLRKLFYSSPPPSPYSFSILFDFNSGSGSKKVGSEEYTRGYQDEKVYTCSKNEVFDVFLGSCRRVLCRSPFVVENGKCVSGSSLKHTDGRNTSCAGIKLESSEFTLFDNNSLQELSSGRIFQEEAFHFENTSAFVCLNYSQNYTATSPRQYIISALTFSSAQIIFSVVCMLISMVFLILTVTIYCVLPALRNVPGKCVMALSASLFTAYLLLLVASPAEQNDTACVVVAVLMHYFFLAAFCWMNALSINIFLTFSKDFISAGSSNKSMSRFIKYSLYGWLTPLLPVLVGVTIDHVSFHSDFDFKPNYGKGICWISNKTGLFLFFAIPLSVLILSNITCFVFSTKTIIISKRNSSRVLGKEERGAFLVYVKLFLIMGLTWIFGFLATVVSHPAMWYIYIALNALQGLFICLSFVLNKRVFCMLKTKITGSKGSSSQGQQMYTLQTLPSNNDSEQSNAV